MTSRNASRLFAIFLAGSAAMAMIAPPASAQEPAPTEMLSRADSNGDGDVSWDEVMALRADSFERLDRNSDGVINADDSPNRLLKARFDEAFERVQANFDGDRDGQVTREEMMGAPAPVFEKGDVDGDGVLTAEETAALRDTQAPS